MMISLASLKLCSRKSSSPLHVPGNEPIWHDLHIEYNNKYRLVATVYN